MENTAIVKSINQLFSGVDERDWEKVRQAMGDSVLLDYSSLSGKPAETLRPEEVVISWQGFLPAFDRTQHQIDGLVITREQDVVLAHFHGKADHFFHGEVWTVEGNYELALARVNDTWVITALRFHLLQLAGNLDLPARALQAFSS